VRNLALVNGSAPHAIEALLDTLSPEQGMLYYHLLLARLETRGDLAPTPG
jgi:DNA-3-methyladenine glycosylase II